ncbi:sulfatase family protein [Coraliomargarita sp. W4R72]
MLLGNYLIRRCRLLTACVFILVSVSSLSAIVEKPLNILVLYADDWRHDTLGVAGHPVVKTPELDRFAGQGIRFTENYVTTAICSVSRASLYTGQWMSRHGARDFGPWNTSWEETYPGLLRANGYYLGHVGKWHNGSLPVEAYDFATEYYGYHWFQAEDGSAIHVTQRNEQDALRFLRERPQDQPFCLTVAFFAPHAEDEHPDQFRPQPQSMSLYQDVMIPVPSNATEASWQRLPDFFDEANEGRNRWHWRFDTPEKYQSMMKNYFRLISEVDATCGRVLQELERQGVLDTTLVIFTTDNGYYHAEHGLADKWYPHQESIRVPLIIRDPRMADAKHGDTNSNLTLNVDLAPTILAAAGVERPENMQGEDIALLYLAGVKPDWRNEFFYEHPVIGDITFIPPSQALVRKDWKYIYWPTYDVKQLFDLRADPREENDLAQDSRYQARLLEMQSRFETLQQQAR